MVDDSRWVLGVGRESSFVRKIKATQKMDARVCVHAVRCERDFERLAEIAASYKYAYSSNGCFNSRDPRETTKH